MPRKRCTELKSLKEYLFSYRNPAFSREHRQPVPEDVVKACKPVWAVVRGEFRPRGGIGTTVEALAAAKSVGSRKNSGPLTAYCDIHCSSRHIE